jgi:opacity protein-like surface antigen
MRRGIRSLVFVAAVLFVAVTAQSVQASDLNGLYVGGNFGRARNSYDTGAIDTQIFAEAASAGDTSSFYRRDIRKMSDVWSADVGYFFSPNIGVDAAFLHLGEIKYIAAGTLASPITSQSLVTTNEVNSHGPVLSLVLRLALTESIAVDARAGDYYGKATLDNTISVGPNTQFVATSKSVSSLLAGIGASYTFAGHWSLRTDYLHVHQTGDQATVGKFSVNLVTAGLSFTF